MDIECVDTIADLKALSTGIVRCVAVLGYHEPSDGGGGQFFWDGSFNLDTVKFHEGEDFGTVIKPNSLASSDPGRWRRIFDDPLSVKWFGATGDGLRSDTSAIQNAIRAVKPGGQLVIPAGTYNVSSLHIEYAISLEGIGKPKITSHDASPPLGEFYAVIVFDNPNKDVSGDIKINNLEVQYTGGKKLDASNHPIAVNGIFVNIKGRLKCEHLEVHGASYSGILASASGEVVLEYVYCHNNGYAGANFAGSGGVVALPGCSFENNGGESGVGWNDSDGYGISIHNPYGIVMGCRFSGNYSQQIDCHGPTEHMIVIGNTVRFNGKEGPYANGVSITFAESVLVTNNIIEGSSIKFVKHEVLGAISVVGQEICIPSLSHLTIKDNIIRDFPNLNIAIRVYSMDTDSIVIKDNQIMKCMMNEPKKGSGLHSILVQNAPSPMLNIISHRHIARQVRIEDNIIQDSGPITIFAASELWFSGNSWTLSKTEMEIKQDDKIIKIDTTKIIPFYIAEFVSLPPNPKKYRSTGRVHIDQPNRICGPTKFYVTQYDGDLFTSIPKTFSWGLGDKAPNVQPKEGKAMEWICTTPGSAQTPPAHSDEPLAPTKCTVKESSTTIDQIEDVSNLLPGDFIKVKEIDYIQFGDNSVVEVIKVDGAITTGIASRGDVKITDVTKHITKAGTSQNCRYLIDRFFKEGDYIMVDGVTFGTTKTNFVRVKSVDRVSLTLTLDEVANQDTPKGGSIIRVNRCIVKTAPERSAVNASLSWQKAVFSSVGSLTRV
jgi:parallel beta helix pectate lyase-like protein